MSPVGTALFREGVSPSVLRPIHFSVLSVSPRGEIRSTGHWLLKYLRTYRIHLHFPLPDVTLIQNGGEPHSTCCLSLPAHRGRPAVLGGCMEFHTCGHLKQDGVFCNSPALRGRSSRYFDFNLRGRRLNHANPEPNSLRLNILPASLTGSIFCADFRLSPPVFSRFYGQGGGGGGHTNPNFHLGNLHLWPPPANG